MRCLGVIGPELKRLPVAGGGRALLALAGLHQAEVVVGFGVIRAEPERLAQTRRGFIQPSQVIEHDAKIAMDFRTLGFEGCRLAQGGGRLLEPAELGQSDPKVCMRRALLGLDGKSALNRRYSVGRPAQSQAGDSQAAPYVRILGSQLQDAPVEQLRLAELARLVQRHGLGQ